MPKFKVRKAAKRRTPTPLVEAIPGQGHKEWEIQHAGPGTARCRFDDEKGTMFVPLSNDPCEKCGANHSEATRLHEMIHAAHSPDPTKMRTSFTSDGEKYEVSPEAISVAEEMRADWKAVEIARRRKLKYEHTCSEDMVPHMTNLADTTDLRELAMMTLASSSGLSDLTDARDALHRKRLEAENRGDKISARKYELLHDAVESMRDYGSKIKQFARENYDKNFDSWSRQLHIGKAIDEYLDIWEDAQNTLVQNLTDFKETLNADKDDLADMQEKVRQAHGEAKGAETGEKETEAKKRFIERLRGTESMKSQLQELGKLTAQVHDDGEDTDDVQWGRVEFQYPPLPNRLPGYKLNAKPKASDEGAIPMYMHRYAVDKAVFRATRREETGSVLVDVSGSMSMSYEELKAIIAAAPAGIVALYSGAGDHGYIRIIGHRGKWMHMDERSPYIQEMIVKWRKEGRSENWIAHNVQHFAWRMGMPGGNQIDKPALEWLAEQPLPRIWVSDGQVVSTSHGYSVRSVEDCIRVVKKARINRVNTPEEAHQALIGKLALWR